MQFSPLESGGEKGLKNFLNIFRIKLEIKAKEVKDVHPDLTDKAIDIEKALLPYLRHSLRE